MNFGSFGIYKINFISDYIGVYNSCRFRIRIPFHFFIPLRKPSQSILWQFRLFSCIFHVIYEQPFILRSHPAKERRAGLGIDREEHAAAQEKRQESARHADQRPVGSRMACAPDQPPHFPLKPGRKVVDWDAGFVKDGF